MFPSLLGGVIKLHVLVLPLSYLQGMALWLSGQEGYRGVRHVCLSDLSCVGSQGGSLASLRSNFLYLISR